ncbi:hypothetical protein [Corynebacterium timonense]|uniref:3-methyladenine DNA glycosylase n=1 Tax=Corynebacterium timonense TaxID=441500 RepID=A0A1H1PB24_9CORY|nr:hypothetical protein [Corynebacterium timonense]SDS08353.1 hypothetical protein SAMN04488539_0970 [Corynebacterium timonense]
MRTTLAKTDWQARQAHHERRADRWVGPHRARRSAGTTHPVWDFLFDYYRLRPSHLKRWQPGIGVELEDADTFRGRRYVDVDTHGTARLNLDELLEHRGADLRRVRDLVARIGASQAHFDCFGLHEWAMVYRTGEPRHDLPLRLGAAGTDAVVESHQLRCSHIDAYRFFTPAARPLNLTVLTREGQADNDQPGCVHVTMDLYKWAAKAGPIVPGDLLLDCFELATRARRLDMEASPYDCRGLGFDVVPIETPEGKAEYVRRQRELSDHAQPRVKGQNVCLTPACRGVRSGLFGSRLSGCSGCR